MLDVPILLPLHLLCLSLETTSAVVKLILPFASVSIVSRTMKRTTKAQLPSFPLYSSNKIGNGYPLHLIMPCPDVMQLTCFSVLKQGSKVNQNKEARRSSQWFSQLPCSDPEQSRMERGKGASGNWVQWLQMTSLCPSGSQGQLFHLASSLDHSCSG